MVYRSSRRPPSSEDESHNLQDTTSFDSDGSDKEIKFLNQNMAWRGIAVLFIVISLGLLVGIIILASDSDGSGSSSPVCGKGSNSIKRVIDLSEPDQPGPFHDLTKKEIKSILSFLRKDPALKLKPIEEAKWSDATVYTMELLPAKKAAVTAFLAGQGPQPAREARVIMYRPDLNPPVVQELRCGPLPNVNACPLLESTARRNNIEYTLRPIMLPTDWGEIFEIFFPKIDKQIGHIMRESFGAAFTNCKGAQCLKFYPGPIGSNIVKDASIRRMWLTLFSDIEYYAGYPLDFGLLVDLTSHDPRDYKLMSIWYYGQYYGDVDDFVARYDSGSIKKLQVKPPSIKDPKESFSSLFQRGEPVPKEPQRPPTLVEPDGKRYSIKHREVDYLGWKFNFRMDPTNGPKVNNIRYRGERIVYELGLNEIAVFYSSFNPKQRMTDYTDSGGFLGMLSRSLVPGADCPDTATFISQTFPSPSGSEPIVFKKGFCVFENNNGYPTRRHLSYDRMEGSFYGGMLDTCLVLRSIQIVGNYDYVIDFMFYQTGAVHVRALSTGYILPATFNDNERPYGWQLMPNFTAPIHHHMFSFKADLDISGTSNRYETLDIKPERVDLRYPANGKYHQTKFERSLKTTEKDALFKFDFDKPKYHIVHNDAKRTNLGEPKSYRFHLNGMSKQLVTPNEGNERIVAWARHQLVVTKHKDDEVSSSSPYSMYDSFKPVTDFSKYYEDDENIKDEDLVFWITSGIHHIPHTEDLPITPTVGAALEFFLLPYNYFTHCPSVNSRDHIRIDLKDRQDPSKGAKINRHGYKEDQCKMPNFYKQYADEVEKEPEMILEV